MSSALLRRVRVHLPSLWTVLTFVKSTDPVRLTLNKGFAIILIALSLLAPVYLVFTVSLTSELRLLGLVFLLLTFGAFWLNRNGSAGGALMYAGLLVSFVAFRFWEAPIVSDDGYAVVHVGMTLAPVVATVFVAPKWGAMTITLQGVVLVGVLIGRHAASFAELQEFAVTYTAMLFALWSVLAVSLMHWRRAISHVFAWSQLGQLGHDGKNWLMALTLPLMDIQAELPSGSQAMHEARHLERQIIQIGGLFENLQMIAQAESSTITIQRRMLDLAQLTRERVEVQMRYALQEGIVMTVEAEPATITQNPVATIRILDNLLVNAIRYTSGIGNAITIQVRDEGSMIRWICTDTGRGLTAEQIAAIGTAFTRFGDEDGPRGSGTGVWAVRSILEQIGGRMRYSSAGVNRGTTVEVWFPKS